MARNSADIATALNRRRDAFKAFLVSRVGNAADAEDILQNSLLKAVRHADKITAADQTTAWFYRILRNAIIDHYRTQGAVRRRNDLLDQTLEALGENSFAAPSAWKTQFCGCLGSVIDSMKPGHAALLRRVELEDQPVNDAARALGLTPGNASTTLHRARKELRIRLQAFCGACADGACLDCACRPAKDNP